jgi:hypothetical protein
MARKPGKDPAACQRNSDSQARWRGVRSFTVDRTGLGNDVHETSTSLRGCGVGSGLFGGVGRRQSTVCPRRQHGGGAGLCHRPDRQHQCADRLQLFRLFARPHLRNSANLKFSSIEALADLYVAGGFRITGGAIYSANKLDLSAKLGAGGSFTMNDVTYSGVDSASATVDLGRKRIAPYFGIGYSSRPNGSAGLGFYFDVGIVHQSPEASINVVADPAVTGDPTFQANKAQEEVKLRDAVSSASNWPVLMFGMSYTF